MRIAAMLSTFAMTDSAARAALDRIETALRRIEGAMQKPRPAAVDDLRYQNLRASTQSALSELETVIARLSAGGAPR